MQPITQQAYLAGNHGINEKRAEIDAVVRGLTGLLHNQADACLRFRELHNVKKQDDSFLCTALTGTDGIGISEWRVRVAGNTVTAIYRGRDESTSFSFDGKAGTVPLHLVREIHLALPTFFDAMFREFPVLRMLTLPIRDEHDDRHGIGIFMRQTLTMADEKREELHGLARVFLRSLDSKELRDIQTRRRRNDKDYVHLGRDRWTISMHPSGTYVFITCRGQDGSQIFWNEAKNVETEAETHEAFATREALLHLISEHFPKTFAVMRDARQKWSQKQERQ